MIISRFEAFLIISLSFRSVSLLCQSVPSIEFLELLAQKVHVGILL